MITIDQWKKFKAYRASLIKEAREKSEPTTSFTKIYKFLWWRWEKKIELSDLDYWILYSKSFSFYKESIPEETIEECLNWLSKNKGD